MNIEVPAGQQPLGRLIAALSRQLTARMAMVLEQHALTEAGWWLLTELAVAPDGGLPLNEVARRARLGASTATLLSDQFAERGLLVRERSPQNRRLVLAQLTEAGRRRVTEVRGQLNELFGGTYARLTADEQQTLSRLLTRMLDPDDAG
ncbi:MarR family winged helix-turn-helix transcriptional regulator [Actinoplanes teichomyceticus]|uniref:MarR family transcriptional regulator n=1 Tax=Actinoplanes teichomyceticus TaxID=1867 RepID=A0A561VID7_ACTTI|nr:MarR family transcriptional regulator [Actinoplanes teichomyceticus]TWG11347.1 MarR family transcriptional regulator [Actinoplanes teichomyceticus]GIF16381.1 hypothetical protein Ate01nite_64130 [Actinoplanes teichomyceticus]